MRSESIQSMSKTTVVASILTLVATGYTINIGAPAGMQSECVVKLFWRASSNRCRPSSVKGHEPMTS